MTPHPVVIVTGASRGIGAAAARWLAAAGSRVALAARSRDLLGETACEVERLGGEALPLSVDIALPDDCRRVVSETLGRFGRIDALVNNAGVVDPLAPVAEAPPDALAYGIGVNLLGPFYLTHYALPALRKRRGRIVNVSSGAANHPIPAAAAYCAAKAGLNHFGRVLAAEEPEITVVAVRPGVVDTDMQAFLRIRGPVVMPAEDAAYYERLHREGLLEPDWVPARTIAWMALAAPGGLSGGFYDYDDPRCTEPATALLGGAPPWE